MRYFKKFLIILCVILPKPIFLHNTVINPTGVSPRRIFLPLRPRRGWRPRQPALSRERYTRREFARGNSAPAIFAHLCLRTSSTHFVANANPIRDILGIKKPNGTGRERFRSLLGRRTHAGAKFNRNQNSPSPAIPFCKAK